MSSPVFVETIEVTAQLQVSSENCSPAVKDVNGMKNFCLHLNLPGWERGGEEGSRTNQFKLK